MLEKNLPASKFKCSKYRTSEIDFQNRTYISTIVLKLIKFNSPDMASAWRERYTATTAWMSVMMRCALQLRQHNTAE